jgi:predicted nucleotide-binding protein (sugar kinase/HSP70/actin superfamily)
LNDLVTKIRYISQGTKYGTSVQDFAKKILTYAQSSPSLYEYILSALVAAVKGETITRFKKNSRKTKKEKVKLPNLQVTGIASKIAKIKKPSLPPPLRQRPLAGAESE